MNLKSVNEMTLKEKLGQLIIAGFHSLDFDDSLKTLIEDYKVGNIILFTRNFKDANQLYKLNQQIHDNVIKNTGIIPFIGIDQEGGLVTRLMKDVTFAPGAMTCSASSENAAYEAGKMLAHDMIRLGINLNLAPSLDINNNPNNPVINVRSYSDDKDIVAKNGGLFIKGTLEEGVIPCAKHFPGHGDCNVDSHLGLPVINYDIEHIKNMEMQPFIKNIDVPAIMSAHILFPTFDSVPATLSKKMLTNVLRKELGFKGIIISDCLEMNAIKEQYGTPEGALMAIKAGVDMVCISHTLDYQIKALQLIESAVLNGDISIDYINEKVERIIRFKKQTLESLTNNFYSNIPLEFPSEEKTLAQDIVDNSLTKIQGNDASIDKATLVIAPRAVAKTIIEDEFDDRNLAMVLKKSFPEAKVYELVETLEFKEEILTKIKLFQKVIVFTYNAATDPFQIDLINEILKEKQAFVISLKGPFDYHKYYNLHNYMCMYEYTPNSIRTIVNYFNGKITPCGKLPIKL